MPISLLVWQGLVEITSMTPLGLKVVVGVLFNSSFPHSKFEVGSTHCPFYPVDRYYVFSTSCSSL